MDGYCAEEYDVRVLSVAYCSSSRLFPTDNDWSDHTQPSDNFGTEMDSFCIVNDICRLRQNIKFNNICNLFFWGGFLFLFAQFHKNDICILEKTFCTGTGIKLRT